MIASIENGEGDSANRLLDDMLQTEVELVLRGVPPHAHAKSSACICCSQHKLQWPQAMCVCCLAALLLSTLPRLGAPCCADLPPCQLLLAPSSSALGVAVLLSHLLSRALAERPFNSSDAPAWFEATAKLARRKLQARIFACRHAFSGGGMQFVDT